MANTHHRAQPTVGWKPAGCVSPKAESAYRVIERAGKQLGVSKVCVNACVGAKLGVSKLTQCHAAEERVTQVTINLDRKLVCLCTPTVM